MVVPKKYVLDARERTIKEQKPSSGATGGRRPGYAHKILYDPPT